ncbi:hypothetical protein PHET_07300 [Paragonimus heterotremus]|uniref:Uncharacterized protein n=1 Tax=Paragonimus heterotremus TaxID=100268 RepID=A0A8J4T6W0_9TREM|nr:hypothetical protein PHET_07300 [Paragonimus heterotremus]
MISFFPIVVCLLLTTSHAELEYDGPASSDFYFAADRHRNYRQQPRLNAIIKNNCGFHYHQRRCFMDSSF